MQTTKQQLSKLSFIRKKKKKIPENYLYIKLKLKETKKKVHAVA